MPDSPSTVARIRAALPQVGRLDAIWLRPARRQPLVSVDAVDVVAGSGLTGDRFRGAGRSTKREVTLIQAEHIPVIGALSGHPELSAGLLRRNLVISGLPVGALKGRQVRLGADVVLEWTEVCDPCARIEELLGEGGYNAMRGMGGICARVVSGGRIAVGDAVRALPVSAAAG